MSKSVRNFPVFYWLIYSVFQWTMKRSNLHILAIRQETKLVSFACRSSVLAGAPAVWTTAEIAHQCQNIFFLHKNLYFFTFAFILLFSLHFSIWFCQEIRWHQCQEQTILFILVSNVFHFRKSFSAL